MDEFVKILDSNLEYISGQLIGNTIYIEVKSTRNVVRFPYCCVDSKKVHSYYKKVFKTYIYKGIR